MKKEMKNLFMFVAALFMGMAVTACGSDGDDNGNGNGDNGGGSGQSSNTMTVDGKALDITSVQLLQNGTGEDGRLWFVVTASDNSVLNIMVSKNDEGKTIDLSKASTEDIADYWHVYYNVTRASSMEAKQLMMGMGVTWGTSTFVFNAGSTLYYKSQGNNKFQLKYNINGPEYNNNAVTHTLVANWSGTVYNVADLLK